MRTHAVLVLAFAFGCASANDEPPMDSGGVGGAAGSLTGSGGAGKGGSSETPGAGTTNGGAGGSGGIGGAAGKGTGGAVGGGTGGAPNGGAAGDGSAGMSNGGSGAGISSGGSSAGVSNGGSNAGMSSGGSSAGTSNNGGKAGMSSGGKGGMSGVGGAAAGTTATGGTGGCVENLGCELSPPPTTGDLHQDCVNRINQFLTQCACLPPLTRRTDGEACADQMAEYDAGVNMAHAGVRAKICSPGGSQNECPGYSSNTQVIGLCMQQMWDEGPPPTDDCTGACYEEYGHFINMTDPSVTKVACGFFTTSAGKVWAVQNFSR